MNRFPNIHRFTQTLGLCSVALALTQIVPLGAQAATLPSQPGLQFQTSGRERAPGIGDWYTTTTSASTDRIHRYVIDVTQEMLDSNGGSVSIIVHDAESFGNLDEPNGPSDPTRFELRAANGVTVLQSQTVPSGTVDNVTVTFNVTVAGSYQVTSVTGGFPLVAIVLLVSTMTTTPSLSKCHRA
jgi:hypothetical protein